MSETAPLRSALKPEDDADRTPPASGSLKAVQIADPPHETVEEPAAPSDDGPPRQFPAALSARRLSGRHSSQYAASSRSSLTEGSPSLAPQDDDRNDRSSDSRSHQHRLRHGQYYSEKLLAQVGDWLENEKKKAEAAASRRKHRRRKSKSPPTETPGASGPADQSSKRDDGRVQGHSRSDSMDSEFDGPAFDRLQRILEESMASMGINSIPSHSPRMQRSKSGKKSRTALQRTASSDTDYMDGDVIVPSCDSWLDNSKTLSYTGGAVSTDDLTTISAREEKDREAWSVFKNEIIRTAHTLKIKGWRKVPLDAGDQVDVERLSGALTNAVYVVLPPREIPGCERGARPQKLLLRIYGPQVEHLIDRDNELRILQRLARKKIGPRMLGTFKNGRFEEYFNAVTLTPRDLRDPETSRQIAKRMRELHDGIDLLHTERESGPGVWNNWDKWLDNVERITTYLDKQLEEEDGTGSVRRNSVVHAWKANGYICGVPFAQFKETFAKYRDYVFSFYKTQKGMNNRLTFAHNDTQYGNILRLRPDDEKSPLLQPANKHKQLVVIDFEYAAANVPGQEFANHFTEWTYNYHDATRPWLCDTDKYPTPEEQKRFLKAYVDHRPQFPHTGSTPQMRAADSQSDSAPQTPGLHPTTSSSSIVDFMLDARVPPGDSEYTAAERAREAQRDSQVRELMEEARLWRPSNTVQWVAWGIVQAKIPDGGEENSEEMEPDEFDYLSYAQERALFFWGDCVQMGLVKKEELPERLQARMKIVEY